MGQKDLYDCGTSSSALLCSAVVLPLFAFITKMMFSSPQFPLTGLLLISQLTLQISAQECWRPDGTEATDQTACPGVTETSSGPCCQNAEWPNVDPCLSNGYCLSTTAGYLYQGGCTSKSWLGCKNECQECELSLDRRNEQILIVMP